LVGPAEARLVQIAYRGAVSDRERRALALEFEQAAQVYAAVVRESPLEAIRAMGFPEFAETYLRHPKGHRAGEPFVLEQWQREFDRERSRRDARSRLVYGTMFLGLPRGNGKTAYAAGVALHELLRRVGEPDVFFAASSKRQAEIALGFVKGFVRGSKQLSDLLDVSKDSVLCPETDGAMTVLPAQGATAYGLAPAVAICDELHVWEKDAQRELWAALRTGAQKAKDGFVLVISTAPGSSSSLLAGLLDRELAKTCVEWPHDSLAIVRDEDAGVLTWWYGAPEAANIDDQDLWQRCNPASFVTGRDLRRQRLAPGIDSATFAKLHLNRAGVDPGDALISREDWDACRDEQIPVPPGASVYASVEASYEREPTVALVWCGRADDKRAVCRSQIWDGDVDSDQLEQAIAALADRYSLERLAVGAGPALLEPLLRLDTIDVEAVYAGSAEAKQANRLLYGAIMGERLVHDGDPALSRHVLGVRGTWDQHERLDVYRRKQEQRADGWYALAVAHSLLPDADDELLTAEDLIAAGWSKPAPVGGFGFKRA
jgi:phage terminase large subunit-like protein